MGLQVWYDKNSIHKGDKIKDSIINGIAESVVFLVVISKMGVEKTNLVSLVRELHSYNSIALEQLAIHLNLFGEKYILIGLLQLTKLSL